MRNILLGGVAAFLLTSTAAFAASPFDGTWKADVASAQLPKKPQVFALVDGTYDCKTCVPAISVKADGADHAVTGNPYQDSVAITVVDPHTIKEVDKKGGKVVTTTTDTVSADGKTLSFDFTDSSASNAAPVKGSGTMEKVAAGPAGGHAVSGSWRTTAYKSLSDNSITVTYKLTADSFSMSSPTGQSYTARLDGTPAPFKGDPGTDTVSVKKVGDAIEETDQRKGKVTGIYTVTPDAAGTLTVSVQNKLQGSSMSFKLKKS